MKRENNLKTVNNERVGYVLGGLEDSVIKYEAREYYVLGSYNKFKNDNIGNVEEIIFEIDYRLGRWENGETKVGDIEHLQIINTLNNLLINNYFNTENRWVVDKCVNARLLAKDLVERDYDFSEVSNSIEGEIMRLKYTLKRSFIALVMDNE